MKFQTFFKLFTCNTEKGDSSPKEICFFLCIAKIEVIERIEGIDGVGKVALEIPEIFSLNNSSRKGAETQRFEMKQFNIMFDIAGALHLSPF
jgi:hypothetical protein